MTKTTANRADEATMQDALKRMPRPFRKMMEKNKILGLTQRQVILHLHTKEGMSLMKIADTLGISCGAVCQHWKVIKEEVFAQALKTPEEQAMIRERITGLLWATVESTFESTTTQIDAETGDEVEVECQASPQMLAVRVKTLEVLAKAYGINVEADADTGQSYSAPDDVVQRVRAKMLELNGRPDLAKKLLDKPAL